ncbi:MAG: hypothetical protein Q9O62_06840 [Ardenticatenia bacterium]|nr:hypothetical protein [Ardenticatenia bacterium]
MDVRVSSRCGRWQPVLVRRSDVRFLAWGYVASELIGVLTYLVILWRLFARERVLQLVRRHGVMLPVAEVLAFTVPLLTSDLVYTVMNTVDAILVERFQGTVDVAALRAVQPNETVFVHHQAVLDRMPLLLSRVATPVFAALRFGVGMQNKILEALAMEVPVVASPLAADGLQRAPAGAQVGTVGRSCHVHRGQVFSQDQLLH